MREFLQYGLFGIGQGSLFAMLGAGIVLVYRGSGTVNFAQAALGLVGGYGVYELQTRHGLPFGVAFVLSVVAAALVALAFHLLVLRPLRNASAVVRVVATLGLLTVLQQAVVIRYPDGGIPVSSPLPSSPVTIGGVTVGQQTFWLLGLAVVSCGGLWLFGRLTILGVALSAAAQNQRSASALGWSTNFLAAFTWSVGGAVAGVAGALSPAVTQNAVNGLAIQTTIVAALATALLARFSSYPLALLGGLLIGVAQSESVRYIPTTGVGDAVPFLVIMLILVVQGRSLPTRGTLVDRLPRVGDGRLRIVPLVGLGILGIVLPLEIFNDNANAALILSVTAAIIGASVVVVTGYAGQLSLAPIAFAGVGAWITGRLYAIDGYPFWASAALGIAGTAVVGILFGLPAVRTRGVNLAVVTFGLAFAVQAVVFNSSSLSTTPNSSGIDVSVPTLLGVQLDPFLKSGTYAATCIVVLLVVLVVVTNLRRGRVGRRLLSVRTNERAAASLGINVAETKLFAFSLSAAIAAAGGILLAFTSSTIIYSSTFDPFQSVFLVATVVIGGLGYASGPLFGAMLAANGLGILIVDQLTSSLDKYVQLIGGFAMLVLVLLNRDGMASELAKNWHRVLRSVKVPARVPTYDDLAATARTRVAPKSLRVSGLTQRFGGVVALDAVDLELTPGKVLGLLGPNGAGKTTLIDAVTGYVRPSAGSVLLADEPVHRLSAHQRARRGLTRSFQSLELFDDITVRENLLAASESRDRRSYLADLFWPRSSALPSAASAAIDELGLRGVLDTLPSALSYGERRLVAIARAIAGNPSVLLLDEPAAGLDESESQELGRLIRRLADEWGIAVLLIEHDVAMVMKTADRIAVLNFGRKIADGTPSEIRHDPEVIAAYLGAPAQTATAANQDSVTVDLA